MRVLFGRLLSSCRRARAIDMCARAGEEPDPRRHARHRPGLQAAQLRAPQGVPRSRAGDTPSIFGVLLPLRRQVAAAAAAAAPAAAVVIVAAAAAADIAAVRNPLMEPTGCQPAARSPRRRDRQGTPLPRFPAAARRISATNIARPRGAGLGRTSPSRRRSTSWARCVPGRAAQGRIRAARANHATPRAAPQVNAAGPGARRQECVYDGAPTDPRLSKAPPE